MNRIKGILRRRFQRRVPRAAGTSVVAGVVCGWRIAGISFAIALSAGGCDLFGDEEANEGRIVIGESVDRVPLGADTLTVRRTLGAPTGISRGNGQIVYRYGRGDYAGLEFHFNLDANRQLESRTVIGIASPYRGQTSGGIGIGGRRTEVLDQLGKPTISGKGSSGFLHERYRGPHAETSFLYDEQERIVSITMNGPLQ